MINLFANYYRSPFPERNAELDECLAKNIANPLIGKIYCIGEVEPPTHEKIIYLNVAKRPTFEFMFKTMAEQSSAATDINILANLDIYFNDTISLFEKIEPKECFALSRWEMGSDGVPVIEPRGDSQDVWAFRGPPKKIHASFHMGLLGCDNALASVLTHCGYKLRNPCLSIQSIHHHKTGLRTYSLSNVVSFAYQVVHCCEI